MSKKLILLLLLGSSLMIFLGCSSKPLPDQGVTILDSKANDVFKAGDFYQIVSKTEPAESEFGAMVTVEFSKDNGKSWEKVEENIPNSGKYLRKVPKEDSAQCRLRVFSQRRTIYRGTSEAFSVKQEKKIGEVVIFGEDTMKAKIAVEGNLRERKGSGFSTALLIAAPFQSEKGIRAELRTNPKLPIANLESFRKILHLCV